MHTFRDAYSQLFLYLISALLLGSCSLARTVPTPSKILSYWVELGPGFQPIARAVVEGDICPSLSVDSLFTIKMTLRSEPTLSKKGPFPVGVCEAELPKDAKLITLDGDPLTYPSKSPQRILVMGDTGCRIKVVAAPKAAPAPSPSPLTSPSPQVIAKNAAAAVPTAGMEGTFIQDCSKPEGWPFARIIKSAAKWNPDLVIHVGDYHYRESDCPAGNPKCKDSVSGDRWESWRQDFFKPAERLLEKAPWIFVRGNHENCARAGNGWFKFLDPRPYLPDAPCNDRTLPYIVGTSPPIAVLDAAEADNIGPSLDLLSQEDETPAGLWLALHRPFMGPFLETLGAPKLPKLSEDMQDPGRISLILAGHLHRLSLNDFNGKEAPGKPFHDKRPLEIITGNSGANLDTIPEIKKTIGVIKGKDFRSEVYKGFGFLTFEKQTDGIWSLVTHDEQGDPVMSCKVHEAPHKKTLLLCQ